MIDDDDNNNKHTGNFDRLKRMIRVLVLEEHPVMRAGIARAIESTEDMVEVEATNPLTDLTAVNRQRLHAEQAQAPSRVPADVIILDVNTKDDSTALSSLETGDSRLVGFSEISEAALIKSVLAKGISGFVQRSESPLLLINAIRAVVADEQFLSPETQRILGSESAGSSTSPTSVRDKQSKAMQTIELLTPREIQVLQLITAGNSTSAAAQTLGLSVKTIETHRKNIGDKIGTRNLASLTKIAILTGLTDL